MKSFLKLVACMVSFCFGMGLMAPIRAEVVFQQSDVFTSGVDGYDTYRIPAIETAPDGTLLALAEGRRDSSADPGGGDIDLVYKTSTDGGHTWSAMKVLDDPGEGWGASNPTTVVDRQNDALWVFYNRWEPGFGSAASQPGTDNCQAWARYSTDNGDTWSAPLDLTHQARDYDNWGTIFFGPGGAIQTTTGRLVVPSSCKPGGTSNLGTMRPYAFYSDDHGATWQRGEWFDVSANENQMIELANGDLMVDARQWSGGNRWNGISTDGGQTWSGPTAGESVTAVACAIERFTLASAGDDRNRILWTGPAGPGRNHLEVRVSYDEGATFSSKKTLYEGPAAYSDMTVLNDRTVGVFWERDSYAKLTFTRFNLDYLNTADPVKPPRPDPVSGGPVVPGGTTPYAWYRADVGVDTWTGNETRVAWWQDQSGNDRHIEGFGDTTLTNDGVNGKTVLAFDGGDYLQSTAEDWGQATPGTVFAVWSRAETSDTSSHFVYDSVVHPRQFFSVHQESDPPNIETGGSIALGDQHYTSDGALQDSVGNENWAITAVTHTTGSTDTVRINGEEVFVGDLISAGMGGLTIGAARSGTSSFWNGYIAELIVFEGVLSAAEVESIEGTLMFRWGISSDLLDGDLNGDGFVGGDDLDIVRSFWGQTVPEGELLSGDPSGDGFVGGDDLDIVRANWGQGTPPNPNPIPEPAPLLLLSSGLVAWLWRPRVTR